MPEMTHKFHNPGVAHTFTLAGRATLTVSSLKTGARYTFKVCRAENNGHPSYRWFVKLLTGPNNDANYTYVGVLDGTPLRLRLTAKSHYAADSIPVKAFCWFWNHVTNGKMPPHTEVRHEGHCGRCGRTLTVPESIDRGIGPKCAEIMGLAPVAAKVVRAAKVPTAKVRAEKNVGVYLRP